MTARSGPIVLVLRDAALRSLLAARFGMAGEPVITGSLADARIASELDPASVVLIDEGTLRETSPLSKEQLSRVLPLRRTFILAGKNADLDRRAGTAAEIFHAEVIDYDDAVEVVLARLAEWRGEGEVC